MARISSRFEYEDAWDNNPDITRDEAVGEVSFCGYRTDRFLEEFGDRDTYPARDVMKWVGYKR